jgi:hypothetical protein
MDESDIVYLGNVNAIKCAILATTAEDNADIERSGYHWQSAASYWKRKKMPPEAVHDKSLPSTLIQETGLPTTCTK